MPGCGELVELVERNIDAALPDQVDCELSVSVKENPGRKLFWGVNCFNLVSLIYHPHKSDNVEPRGNYKL